MSVANETMGMTIIAPASHCDLNATEFEQTIISVAAHLGFFFSCYSIGFLCDQFGRWKIIFISSLSSILISIVSMFMTSLWTFIFLRFLVGFAIAGASFGVVTYIVEFTPQHIAPIMVAFLAMFNGFSMVYCPGIAALLLEHDWYIQLSKDLEFRPWRLLGLIFIIPGILGCLLLMYQPESPKFLLSMERKDEALNVLEWVSRMNRNKYLEDFGITGLQIDIVRPKIEHCYQSFLTTLIELLQPSYVVSYLISALLMFGLFFIAMGMGLWFTIMRNRVDLLNTKYSNETLCHSMDRYLMDDLELDDFVCNDSFMGFSDSILLGIAFIGIYIIIGYLLKLFPRKFVFISALIVGGVCGLLLGLIKNSVGIRVALILFLAIPAAIINILKGAIAGFFPTHIRSTALCGCLMMGHLGAVMGSMLLGDLLRTHCAFSFNCFSAVMLSCAAITDTLPL